MNLPMAQTAVENLSVSGDSHSGEAKETLAWEIREKLAQIHGTPAYLYEAEIPALRARELQTVFPETVPSRLLYSFKANPLPSLAAVLRQSGCEADLTSPGEILAAKEAGYDLSRALYGGPGKGADEYLSALDAGISHFSVESSLDLERLSEASGQLRKRAKVLLRVNPLSPPRAKLAMSGVASQFGFEEEELRREGGKLLSRVGDGVSIIGMHLYWGTQIAEPEALLSSFETTIDLAEELSDRVGFPLEILNLGGGFAWPYAHSGTGPDLMPLKEGLSSLLERGGAARSAEWWFESGRYLTASSGTLVARVMEVKASKEGRLFLILDTGIHHLGGMAGLGRIPRFSIDLLVPQERRANKVLEMDVVGPLCTPLDCIGKKLPIPRVEPGDLVAIPNVGAYGATASVVNFLSRKAPVEVVHRSGEVVAVHRLRTGHETLA